MTFFMLPSTANAFVTMKYPVHPLAHKKACNYNVLFKHLRIFLKLVNFRLFWSSCLVLLWSTLFNFLSLFGPNWSITLVSLWSKNIFMSEIAKIHSISSQGSYQLLDLSHSCQSWYVWSILVRFGLFWYVLVHFGPLWSIFDPLWSISGPS